VKSLSIVAVAIAGALASCHGSSDRSAAQADSGAPKTGAVPSAPMNVTPLPAASVAAYVNPAHLPPYDGPTGSVEGTIRIDGPSSPDVKGLDFTTCPDGARMYSKAFREGAPAADGSRVLPDAIVAVDGYGGYYLPERNEAQTLTIADCAFASRTVAMTFGQRLEIANKTKELWAPMLTQAPMPVLMMATSNGDPVKLYPPHPGYFTLVDKGKHPWAEANVYALLQPLHAVSDVAGHYRIDGVPIGKLKVHARLAAIQRETTGDVEILANVVQKVDLVLHNTPATVGPADAGAKPHVIP
jgi:hypothetical protein